MNNTLVILYNMQYLLYAEVINMHAISSATYKKVQPTGNSKQEHNSSSLDLNLCTSLSVTSWSGTGWQ